MRIGVHKNKPVAGGNAGAAVAGAADLIDRLENHFRAGSAGDVGGAVGGVLVADDQFKFPAARGEGGGGGFNFRERCTEEFFLIEGGDDDGNSHAVKIAVAAAFSTGRCNFRRAFLAG